LIVDFDDLDSEKILKAYKRIVEKENQSSNKQSLVQQSKSSHSNKGSFPIRIKDLDKKPMTSSITITSME